MKPSGERRLVPLVSMILLLGAGCLSAEVWKVYSKSQGLPSDRVLSFAAGKKIIAAGTDNGVAVFSDLLGQWRSLETPPEIGLITAQDLAFDENDSLWVATPKGVVHFETGRVSIMGTEEGLPNPDIHRIQIEDGQITVGCFGGFVCAGPVVGTGKTAFSAVNYNPNNPEIEEIKHLKSLAVTGVGLRKNEGWVSTNETGLLYLQGRSITMFGFRDGLPSNWSDGFWNFRSRNGASRVIAVTSGGLGLIEGLNYSGKFENKDLPNKPTWLSSIAVIPTEPATEENPGEEKRGGPKPVVKGVVKENGLFKNLCGMADFTELSDFLEHRTLWFGTRDSELYRFQDGEWKIFDSKTCPSLAGKKILRLYGWDRRLVICMDGGIMFVAMNSLRYDEFKREGIGSRNFKTLFPLGADARVTGISAGNGLWVSTELGLKRYHRPTRLVESRSGVFPPFSPTLEPEPEKSEPKENQPDETDSQETEEETLKVLRSFGAGFSPSMASAGTPLQQEVDARQVFAKEQGTFPFSDFSAIALDNRNSLWAIVERKYLFRARVLSLDENPKGRVVWDFLKDQHYLPWLNGAELTALGNLGGKLAVGTKNEGFFLLSNPDMDEDDAGKLSWEHYGLGNGLQDGGVIGFSEGSRSIGPWGAGQFILHPTGVTRWLKGHFDVMDVGTDRVFSDFAIDSGGNLWLASNKGLRGIGPDKGMVDFTSHNAGFASNNITSLALSPRETSTGISIWVACDENPEGSDSRPSYCTECDGTTRLCETGGEGKGSLHYFDGLIWDFYGVGGVRKLLCDGDHLFIGTNLRLLRWYMP